MIVDDEPRMREHLANLLENHASLEIIAKAGSVAEAASVAKNTPPDLIFLDIEMPGGSGFDLLPLLDPVPRIIFVTAHSHFAVKAFEIRAIDYLLKPVFAGRLKAAL